MSESISDFIYGSPAPVDRMPADLVADLKEEAEILGGRPPWDQPGPCWHTPYDQNETYLWFGLKVAGLSDGYDEVPTLPDETRAAVDEAYAKLSDTLREILPEPSFLVLTRRD